MHIVVCVKQILDTTDVKFTDAGVLKRDAQPTTINSLDEYAIEEALRLKEKQGGTVTLITMGPASFADVLKHGVAMGADASIHLQDEALAGSDTAATAHALARVIVQLEEKPDLILCGAETVDGNTSYIPAALGELLQIGSACFVGKIEEISADKALLQRMMEQGHDRLEVALPAVISVIKEINEPRISSLKGKMKAKKHKPQVLAAGDVAGLDAGKVGLGGSTTTVLRTFPPEPRPSGTVFEGEPDEVAQQLYDALKK